jgi:hypothetical protein
MPVTVAWKIEALYLDSCNCDWGCPCQFGARPTHGNCEGLSVIHVTRGNYGSVALADLNCAAAYAWPGPIHEGHGRASFYIDDRSSPEQFEALARILTGQAPGGPFEVYASTLAHFQAPRKARIGFQARAAKSRASIDGVAKVELEPMRNPATGKIHRAIIELPGGWETGRTEVTSIKELMVKDGYLGFQYSGTYGSFSRTKWKGP